MRHGQKMSQMNQGQISINCGTKDVEILSTYLMSLYYSTILIDESMKVILVLG